MQLLAQKSMDEGALASDSSRLLQNYTAKHTFTDFGLLLNYFAMFISQYKYLLF